jgi:two-component system phosphate regulon sensor histidine kinase PhoR
MKIRKTYTFSLLSAFYISLVAAISIGFVQFLFVDEPFDLKKTSVFFIIFCFICYFILHYRIQKHIFKRIKKIYENVTDIESPELTEAILNSDIEKVSMEVEKFAVHNKRQIAQLNRRENYRRDFLGNVSHELKTPLFTVQGYLLTLTEGAKEDPEILDMYLNRANKGVDRLISIVKDLDLISKLEESNAIIQKESFNIVELVEGIFEMLEIKAKVRNIALGFDKMYIFPIVVLAEKERIEQVLINLIVNSIKYGRIGGITTVSFENKGRDKIVVKVSDNGEGISESDQKRIFERFYRVDKSRSRDQGGSGLGLSIVKHILESHDEEISIESKVGKGSTFSFTMEKAEKL